MSDDTLRASLDDLPDPEEQADVITAEQEAHGALIAAATSLIAVLDAVLDAMVPSGDRHMRLRMNSDEVRAFRLLADDVRKALR